MTIKSKTKGRKTPYGCKLQPIYVTRRREIKFKRLNCGYSVTNIDVKNKCTIRMFTHFCVKFVLNISVKCHNEKSVRRNQLAVISDENEWDGEKAVINKKVKFINMCSWNYPLRFANGGLRKVFFVKRLSDFLFRNFDTFFKILIAF